MAPELGTTLGVTIGALFLDPHRGREHQVGSHRRDRRVGVGHGHKVIRVAPTGIGLDVEVGCGLHIVIALHPEAVHYTILECAVHGDCMDQGLAHRLAADVRLICIIRLAVRTWNRTSWQFPYLLGIFAVCIIGNHQICGQTMSKCAHFTRGAAGGGLTGEREGAVARLGDLTHQQVHVVAETIDPDAAGMLVEAHGPVGRDLLVGIRIGLGQLQQLILGNLGELGCVLQGIGLDRFGILFEADLGEISAASIFGSLLARIVGTQSIADICCSLGKVDVLVDKLLVVSLILDDVVGDIVEDRQIGLRFEHHTIVGQFEASMFIC